MTTNEVDRTVVEQFFSNEVDIPAQHRRNDYTVGNWATEVASAAAFDTAIGTEMWSMYREVNGVLIQPRPQQINKTMRIDRVLIPKSPLIELGWTHGIVGVELKRSGEKIGPAISQAIDYSRSVWTLAGVGHSRVWLDWVFIWPMPKQGGAMASVLAHNRVGSATPGFHDGYQFKAGEDSLLLSDGGRLRIGAGTSGAKAGRR